MMSSPSRREPVLVSTEFVLHRSPYHSMESVYYYCHICKQPFDYGESLRELDPEVKCPTCKDTFVERVVDRGTPQDTGDGVQSQMVPGSSVPLLREGGTGFIQPSQPAIPTSVITHPTRPGGSPINLSRREGSSINPTRPDGSSANLTRPEGPPINLTRPEGSSSLGGSNRQSPFPIEEMGAISQPVEESQPPHQPLLDPSGGVGRDVPRVQEDGEGMTSSQEHMDVGESVPPSTSLPREETVSPQEPTASGGSTHHTSTHFRDRERERRLAFEREREDMWARRRDRFFSPFDDPFESSFRRRRSRYDREEELERSRRPHMVIRMTRGQDGVAQTSLSIFAGPHGRAHISGSTAPSEPRSSDRQTTEDEPTTQEGEGERERERGEGEGREPREEENPEARPQRQDGFINLIQAILGAFGDNPSPPGAQEPPLPPHLANNLPFMPPMFGLLNRPPHLAGNPRDYAWGPRGMDDIITWLHNQMGDGGPPPADRDKVAKLAQQPIGKEHADKECSICQEMFVEGVKAIFVPCGHFFHVNCILPWFDLHDTCPTCRYSINTGTLPSDTTGPSSSTTSDTTGPSSSTTSGTTTTQSEPGSVLPPGFSGSQGTRGGPQQHTADKDNDRSSSTH